MVMEARRITIPEFEGLRFDQKVKLAKEFMKDRLGDGDPWKWYTQKLPDEIYNTGCPSVMIWHSKFKQATSMSEEDCNGIDGRPQSILSYDSESHSYKVMIEMYYLNGNSEITYTDSFDEDAIEDILIMMVYSDMYDVHCHHV
jgi:hypothetical protein